jgi:hypothetical protein
VEKCIDNNPRKENITMYTGRSYGCEMAILRGLRVAGATQYTPGRTDAGGKTISQRLKIPCFLNRRDGRDAERYDITAWGKLADICANLLAPGTEFDCVCRINSYQARNFDNNVQIMRADGTPYLVWKISFSIFTDFQIGVDSRKQVEKELALGIRPANWDDDGAGAEAYRQTRKMRSAMQYVPGSPTYGHAKVMLPAGVVAQPVNAGFVDPAQVAAFMATPQGQAMIAAMNGPAVANPVAAYPAANAGVGF